MNTKILQTAPAQFTRTVIAQASLLIRPVANTDEIVDAWQKYQELKTRLLTTDDYQMIRDKKYIKKSGFRKLQTAFGISDEILKEERRDCGKYFVYEITTRATAPNGRMAVGVGSCGSNERQFSHPDHDVRAISATRSKNRAISDLLGAGEVSSEEMITEMVVEKEEEVVPFAEDGNDVQTQKVYGRVWENRDTNLISEKQSLLLRQLILEKVFDEEERQERLNNLSELSKFEAHEAISNFLRF